MFLILLFLLCSIASDYENKLLFFLSYSSPAGPPERETNGNLHHKFYEKLNVGSFLP